MKRLATLSMAAALVASAGIADAKTLKFQQSSNAGDWAHTYMNNATPLLEQMTNGSLKIEALPTKSVVPHRETIDAVANGILDGDFNAIAYFSGRDPAFAIMGDLIAGFDTPDQYQDYCMHGGGKEMLQKIYDTVLPGKIKVLGCGPYGKEAFVAKVPLYGVDDLKGLKLRLPEGLAADVFRHAGASPSSIPFSEVYTSLERALLMRLMHQYISTTTHQVSINCEIPAGHSPMANLQTIINKKVWMA